MEEDTRKNQLPLLQQLRDEAESHGGILLAKPRNRSTKRIFVAATRMNEGKTTTCLGLFAALRALHQRVGFIKPVGQRFVEVSGHKVDEDSYLLDKIFDVPVPIESMSPIAIDSGFTRAYLEDPSSLYPLLVNKLCNAFDRAAYEMDSIIIEGSGHAGVGSVFDLSNAQTAKLLGAKVILVSSGGIGRPVDEIALNKALFDKHGVEVIGAIINKVDPLRADGIREFVKRGLDRYGVPLLGMIPLQKRLSAPSLNQVVEEVKGRWLCGDPSVHSRRILRVVIGAMTVRGIDEYFQPGVLLITPGDREDILQAAIMAAEDSPSRCISGIILTRNILPDPRLIKLAGTSPIPVIMSDEESFKVASRINTMTVKTQPSDTDKIPVIKRLILENIDLERIVDAFGPGEFQG